MYTLPKEEAPVTASVNKRTVRNKKKEVMANTGSVYVAESIENTERRPVENIITTTEVV